jgi:ABC-type proline/glycine betaine transport system permease subunit
MALIFLADVRWSIYAGIIWWAYSLSHPYSSEYGSLANAIVRHIVHLLRQALVAGLLAAPLALPLMEFTRLSTRSLMSGEDVLTYSLPPARLLGLVFPDFGGFHEWMVYFGGMVFVLGVIVLFGVLRLPGSKFWSWMTGLSLIFSLGALVPGLPLIADLPVVNLLRVPSRAMFLAGMGFSALAAYGSESLLAGLSLFASLSQSEERWARRILITLAGFTLSLSIGAWVISGGPSPGFVWGGGMISASVVWVLLRIAGKIPPRIWYLGVVCICLVDWAVVDRSLFAPRSPEVVFSEGQQVADFVSSQPGVFRTYSPSYSLPQQTSANHGIQLADGVDPLQLRSYVEFMESATGVPNNGYSVTMPPYARGDPSQDNAGYFPDPHLLGLLNVRYVLAEYDLPVEGLLLRSLFGQTRVYENLASLPRAWLEPVNSTETIRSVDLVSWKPGRIEVNAVGTGTLVLAEIDYPGWRVWVDGAAGRIEPAEGLLRSVQIGPGDHRVVFVFYPTMVYLGLVLWIIGVGIVISSMLRNFRRPEALQMS